MMAKAQKRTNTVTRLLQQARRAVGLRPAVGDLCIEITNGTVRCAETKRAHGHYVPPEGWGRTLKSGRGADPRENLAQLLQGDPPGERTVVLVLNPADILVRKQVFPATDPQEISAMVPFQAAALLPLPPEKFIVRHRVLRRIGDVESEVAIIAVLRSPVEQRVQWLAELGHEVATVRLGADPDLDSGNEPATELEFLPPAEQERKRSRAAHSRFLLTAGLALYCVAAATFLIEHRVREQQGQLDEIYTFLQETDAAGKQLNQLQAVNDRMTVHLRGSSVLDWLRDLAASAPSGVTLSEVTVDQGVATVVRGQSTGTDRTLDFVETLRKTALCGNATLEFAGAGSAAGESGTSFEIRIAH